MLLEAVQLSGGGQYSHLVVNLNGEDQGIIASQDSRFKPYMAEMYFTTGMS
jgi:hypothetical protein